MDLDEVMWYEKSQFVWNSEDPARTYKIIGSFWITDEDRKTLTIM